MRHSSEVEIGNFGNTLYEYLIHRLSIAVKSLGIGNELIWVDIDGDKISLECDLLKIRFVISKCCFLTI